MNAARGRWLSSICAPVVAACISGGGCGDADITRSVRSEPDWLVTCQSDAECALGRCSCGVCAAPCSEDAPACSGAPPDAACFIAGSFAHAALCEDDGVAGVCLPRCAEGDDCGAGFTCVVGACLPARSVLGARADAGSSGGSSVEAEWGELFPSPLSNIDLERPELAAAGACDQPAICPTLETLLANDACFEVKRGCGLVFLSLRASQPYLRASYWYDSYGTPPVAMIHASDPGPTFYASRSVQCSSLERSCVTCGEPASYYSPDNASGLTCAEVPGVLPPTPTPPLVDGCSCAEDDSRGAGVSLDCFCSIYGCPSYVELAGTCAVDASAPLSGAARDACGHVWLSTGNYAGRRYAFDPSSGALLGAIAFNPGPVTPPCNTYEVRAGVRACAVTDVCWCQSYAGLRCESADWFP